MAKFAHVLLVSFVAVSGCTEEVSPLMETTSLHVEVLTPSEFGSLASRLSDEARSLKIKVTALNAQAEVDTSVSGDMAVYVHFLGGLTPEPGALPLTTIALFEGVSSEQDLELPPVFGPTFLWVEDTTRDNPTYATGTSPTLWFRDPNLADVSRPADEMAIGALENSPLERKQINVTGSRYGANGRMVVTGIYAQGYTLADSQCADAQGNPPCTTGDYDSIFVFSFSRPEFETRGVIKIGDTVSRLTGSIGEFNGLTEVNFPQSFASEDETDPDRVPAPIKLEKSWLGADKINMERNEAALIAIEGATMCPLDEEYAMYSQWKLDVGNGCEDPINVITKGQVTEFAPEGYEGQVFPRVVGTLRPVNLGSFNVWIIYPRTINDITLPQGEP